MAKFLIVENPQAIADAVRNDRWSAGPHLWFYADDQPAERVLVSQSSDHWEIGQRLEHDGIQPGELCFPLPDDILASDLKRNDAMTTSFTIVERVARAIESESLGSAEEQARAAIEAMREPTEGMSSRGSSAASVGIGKPVDDEAIPRVWRAMIDAALR